MAGLGETLESPWSVGRSVTGKSHKRHAAYHQGPLFPTLLCPVRHPQNNLKFWSIGQSVSWLVSRLGGSHTNDMLPV
jgi:hypothetical protein